MICVDASVALKWVFVAEEHSREARTLLRASHEHRDAIVAPPLLLSEVANAIRQRMRRGQLQLDEARSLLAQFLALPIRLRAPDVLYDRALVLAAAHDLPAIYDAQYVALAQLLGITLWTADQRLLGAVRSLAFVRSISDYTAE